ncbi:TPA: hypothetical protein NI776_001782 [Pseudomonas aeruginosa]|nr:hypothetical protein [Pseudomonas aeruginosa]
MTNVKLEDLSKSQQWLLNGYVALYLSSVDRLAATCAGLTISAMAYPALLLRGEVAVWLGGAHGETLGTIAGLLLMFAGFIVLSRLVGFWIINPLWGLCILAKAQYRYGPVTRRKILEWVVEQGGGESKAPLDIAALARAQGELK